MPGHAYWASVDFYFHRSVRIGLPLWWPPVPCAKSRSVSRRILWAFDVRPAADGSPVDPTKSVSLGLTRMPAPFYFSAHLRHAEARALIENESRDAEIRLREWEY